MVTATKPAVKAPEKKTDWVTPVAVVGGGGMLVFGLWYFFRKKTGGAIVDKWVNKGSFSKQPMPFTCGADGQTFEVGVSYKNTGKESTVLGAEVIVTKPNGEKVQPSVNMAGAGVGEVLSKEYNISKVDQVGEWGIDIRIITDKGDVLNTFKGVVLNVVEEVEEGDWGGPGVILSSCEFSATIGPYSPPVPGDWLPANAELDRVPFTVLIVAAAPSDWLPANAELDRKSFSVLITAVGGKAPPEIDTLPAENITHESVTLSADLVDEGFCSGAYCYIKWGKTTSYGNKTTTVRLQPGQSTVVDIAGLDPDTKYYFRAVAEGRCVSPYLVDYGQARNFTTKAEEVVGFGLRVVGAPSNATYWNCRIEWETGEKADLWPPIPIGSTWHYEGEVLSSRVDMTISCYEKSTGGAYVKSQRWKWVFRLYAGRDYVYDFSDIFEKWWEV